MFQITANKQFPCLRHIIPFYSFYFILQLWFLNNQIVQESTKSVIESKLIIDFVMWKTFLTRLSLNKVSQIKSIYWYLRSLVPIQKEPLEGLRIRIWPCIAYCSRWFWIRIIYNSDAYWYDQNLMKYTLVCDIHLIVIKMRGNTTALSKHITEIQMKDASILIVFNKLSISFC